MALRRPIIDAGGATARVARTKRAGEQRYAVSAGSLMRLMSATWLRVSIASDGVVVAMPWVQPDGRSAAVSMPSPMRPRPSVS